MSDLVDQTIAALRAHHDDLAELVGGLSAEQLRGPSGASEWTLAQVLSHLGSGAEITSRSVAAATGAEVSVVSNETIWDRWNAASPEDQAAAYVEHDARLVAALEGIAPAERDSVLVDLGFMPEPVPLDVVVGMRLNEVAAHAWDAHVGLQPDAALRADSARLLLEHFAGGLGFLLGSVAKPETLGRRAVVAAGDATVVLDDPVRVTREPEEATATFTGPSEALVRLMSGRLGPEHTPAGVEVTGEVTLENLRAVFPGY